MRELAAGDRDWPYGEDEYETDVALIAAWLTGADYRTIGAIPRVYKAGLFGGSKNEDRSSDAAEQIGRVAYSSGWAFGAVRQVAAHGPSLPPWLRSAFELGMPSQTACGLVREIGLTRNGASLIASLLPPEWDSGRPALPDFDRTSLEGLGLTTLDLGRLEQETGQ